MAVLAVLAWPARGADAPTLPLDPQALHRAWEQEVADGRLADAAATLHELEDLLADEPGWDPTGTFRQRILPSANERLRVLLDAEADLAAFRGEALTGLALPEVRDELATAQTFRDWFGAEIQRSRVTRDRILEAIATPGDREALCRTEAFEQSDRYLKEDLVSILAHEFDGRLAALLDADERVRILKARLDDTKREAIEANERARRLEQELTEASRLARDAACPSAAQGD